MSDATVFCQVQRIKFDKPVAKFEAEQLLEKFMVTIGEPLSYNKIILGHIKMLARASNENIFLFLSLTRLDHADVKPSPGWANKNFTTVDGFELTVNVLVFGYSKAKVTEIVAAASEQIAAVSSKVKVKTNKMIAKLPAGKRQIGRLKKEK